MVGITSIGAYVPIYRLSGEEIAKMWGGKGTTAEKAVAGCDEDSITMAVAAALQRIRGDNKEKMDGLYFATTTAPYKEKQSAAIIAGAIDLEKTCCTIDFTNSLRAGSLALKSAIDAVKAGSSENIMVLASDCRIGAAQSTFEKTLGDGAASVVVGSQNVIAEFEGSYSVFNEFVDAWRTEDDTFERSAEERFVDVVGYRPVMNSVIAGLLDKYKLSAKDFAKVVFYAPDAKSHGAEAKSLGFEKDQIQDSFYTRIGNTGTAATFIMLADAINNAAAGDRILFITYGDGADAFIFRITEKTGEARPARTIMAQLEKKVSISYARYAQWRGLIKMEASTLAERPPVSIQCLSREKKNLLALYGVKCKSCGTPQYPASRVCAMCHTKDNFEDYKFSHRKGTLFTFSIDRLEPTLNPPGVNGVVDFEGGGRLVCDLTDCNLETIHAGATVEMTFRKLYRSKGINSYFWMAKPIQGV